MRDDDVSSRNCRSTLSNSAVSDEMLVACSNDKPTSHHHQLSSVVNVIPSAPQVTALQPIVSRSHHLICPLDCQTALCNISNLEVAMLHRDLLIELNSPVSPKL